MSQKVNKEGLTLVKQFEGLKTTAYKCPAGVWTIGYGHTGDVKPGMTVTDQEAEDLLANDLEEAGQDVLKLVKIPLNENQFAALVSFVFNVGEHNLSTSTLLRKLNKGEYNVVPVELSKWVKAKNPKTGLKVTLPGLVKRRAAEGDLWLKKTSTDKTYDPFIDSEDMPQAVFADDEKITYAVNAASGLKMREGAGPSFDVLQVIPCNTLVDVIKEKDGWAAIDISGDETIDGWVYADYLKPVVKG